MALVFSLPYDSEMVISPLLIKARREGVEGRRGGDMLGGGTKHGVCVKK